MNDAFFGRPDLTALEIKARNAHKVIPMEWVRIIRTTLGMNLSQLALRMNITRQSVTRLEANEAAGTITIRSLQKLAEALDCKFVYELIRNEEI